MSLEIKICDECCERMDFPYQDCTCCGGKVTSKTIDKAIDNQETISITDENGNVYEFEKPEFECDMLKVYNKSSEIQIVGCILTGSNKGGFPEAVCWNTDGNCFGTFEDDVNNSVKEYSLTPIAKQWYEDESNFPALIIDKKNKNFGIAINYNIQSELIGCDDGGLASLNDWRLTTKQERDSLYVEQQ